MNYPRIDLVRGSCVNYPSLPLLLGHVCTQDMAQSSHGVAPVSRERRIKVINTHYLSIFQYISGYLSGPD